MIVVDQLQVTKKLMINIEKSAANERSSMQADDIRTFVKFLKDDGVTYIQLADQLERSENSVARLTLLLLRDKVKEGKIDPLVLFQD